MVLVPADEVTERFLRDSVGGYLHVVLPHALGNTRLTGEVQYRDQPHLSGDLRLLCQYADGEIRFTRVYVTSLELSDLPRRNPLARS